MEKFDILEVDCPICKSLSFHYKTKDSVVYDIAVCNSCGFEAEISHVDYTDTWTDHYFEYEGIEHSINITKPIYPDISFFVCSHIYTHHRGRIEATAKIICSKCAMEFSNGLDLEYERGKAGQTNDKMVKEFIRNYYIGKKVW